RMPDCTGPASVHVKLTATLVLFQPWALADGVLLPVMTGFVVSILMLTETELLRPAPLVAEQVRAVPAVSVVKFDAVQPEELAMPDSGSVTLQVTETGVVLFQPAALGEGLTV